MFIAVHRVMHYAHFYTRSNVTLYAECYTRSEAMCSLLYME